jgi:hypothetical protein
MPTVIDADRFARLDDAAFPIGLAEDAKLPMVGASFSRMFAEQEFLLRQV